MKFSGNLQLGFKVVIIIRIFINLWHENSIFLVSSRIVANYFSSCPSKQHKCSFFFTHLFFPHSPVNVPRNYFFLFYFSVNISHYEDMSYLLLPSVPLASFQMFSGHVWDQSRSRNFRSTVGLLIDHYTNTLGILTTIFVFGVVLRLPFAPYEYPINVFHARPHYLSRTSFMSL